MEADLDTTVKLEIYRAVAATARIRKPTSGARPAERPAGAWGGRRVAARAGAGWRGEGGAAAVARRAPYSSRSATAGSTREARRAGSQAASSAAAASARAATRNEAGSPALTP